MIHVTANAKINLSLEITGRRDDGFHELVSVMQAVDVSDELVALPSPDGSLSFECNDPALLESDENTVTRAARLLKESLDIEQGARLLLRKSIPLAAGLGGGSADGAAALVALSLLWDVPVRRERLLKIAAEVGSDVPFFMGESPTALVQGRGETITALPSMPPMWAVILVPEVPVPSPKTRVLFRMLDESLFSDGEETRRLQGLIESGSSPHDILAHVAARNTFNAVADRAFPGIGRFRDSLRTAAGDEANVSLSGAGPSLYAVLPTREAAEGAAAILTQQGLTPIVAGTAERPLAVLER